MAPPTTKTTVQTNTTAGSVCDDKHTPILFDVLWDNYPSEEHPCHPPNAEVPKAYENQCSIKVGLAMEKSGVTFKSYRGARCPWGPKDGGMVTSAQGLADWLKNRPFCGCPSPEMYTGETVFDKISHRSGIVFFADYWVREGGQRTGDHIDLWSGRRLKSNLVGSILRVQLGIAIEGTFSDFRLAKEVLFWPIK